jgi:glycoside/pentoside/hexuronide:cation symporter, GPH family
MARHRNSASTRPAPALPIREKIGYGLGDCAANFVFQTQIMFLMSFYTDVFGISAVAAGNIFLFSRLWDAVNDPIMGSVADRTTTRWGKFRPWVLATALPFAGLFVLCYTTPDFSYTGKIIWAVITYNALMMMYTANNIPYSALTGVMTGDMAERASLVQWRFVMAMMAQFAVQTYTLVLVKQFGGDDPERGYQMTMSLWAVLAILFFIITFATTKERIAPPPQQKSSPGQDLKDLFHNPNWLSLAAATVFIFIALVLRGSATPYYFQYYLERTDLFGVEKSREQLMGWFNGVSTALTIVGVLLSKPLVLRFGKRDVFRAALFGTALCALAFYMAPPTAVEAIFALHYLLQLIYGVSIPLLWAMMADVADFNEWKTSRRATAMTFAATVFALKLGLSLGGALQGYLLEYYGYQPNVAQSALAKEGISKIMSLFPAISFVIAVAILTYYRIDRRTEHEMHDALSAKRIESSIASQVAQ